MKKIRKGNDITVTWSIYDKDTGIAYDLEGRNITLYAGRSNNMHSVPFAIDGNNVIWHFAGKDQEEIGTYSLILVENEGSADMRTVDVCNAFLLVSHTCACTPSQDDENVETETVELASEITPVEGGVGIGEPTATAESVPYDEEATVTVESSGSVSARVFSFHFEIPEGKPGQDGQNGKDGEQGHTPIVGVAKYTDGIYYWTVDGTWLKDSLGAMVSAQGYDGADGKDGKDGKDGADGRDGITPKLKIENDYWYVSYDNGTTWAGVAPAVPSNANIDLSSYATKEEVTNGLNGKVDKVEGKQLSTEDFTTLLKNKLEGLSNYDDSTIATAVESLRSDFDTLVSGDTTTAIKSFNDITAFLSGIEDSENLDSIIAAIEQQIASKQDTIADLDEIRNGAAKGATALQSYEEQYKGTVKGVKINGSTKNPDADGLVDLGNIVGGGGDNVIVPTKLSELENDNMTFVGRNDLIRDNVDANNITAPGAYLVQTGNGPGSVNFPEPYGIMSVFHACPDLPNRYLCQIFVSQTKLYWRWKLDTWEEWRETLPILNGIVKSKLIVDGEFVANGLRSQDWNPSDIDTLKFPFGLEVQAIASYLSSIPEYSIDVGSILETLKWDLNAANQMYYSTGTNNVFYRSRWGGVWRSWREFAFLDSNGASPSSGTYTINGSIKANDYLDAYGISLYETFATKTELGNINAVLDAINGEVI